ncbi:YccT family protein [Vibrio metoecus]|uniref:YccT family protein n=1 Tax=Vibrio metoecus TaxID=1481663 RepID=UPI0006D78400|nr:DUF2057 domain-containing protein [Vibrio metoecus]KQB10480.1 VvgS protein [Vibrio metoecus]PAR23470.1 DUF2057 domain-containing protein [Vibrio metoecus]PAR27024.1 DUF2057 domain-containing protein [Vibrio metoecus]PAR31927.1 DUF2057 domain-containing protein [Vibrio metoecus]PAR37643.1 DUF2057 domain-containing protein [Vibrio metoecus]
MKNWPKMLLCSAALLPFSVHAAVDIKLAEEISPIVVNGDEVGIRINKLSDVTLDNGTHQLVVRVSKLVMGQSGYEKFNSNPLVLTFSANNQNLTLAPDKSINTLAEAKAFDAEPKLTLTDVSTSKPIEVLQAELPRLQGITRDYLKELSAYNKKNNLLPVEQAVPQTAVLVVPAQEVAKADNGPTSVSMIQYLFGEANAAERQEFANWAFANRAEVTQPISTSNKLVDMMADWYKKADKAEKASILSWLISQE